MSENQSKKRERGANYTPEEKALLADLVNQYKHVIENKRTGSMFIKNKKVAWLDITRKYNSNCTTGNRGTDQLKALYDNMKQKARKDIGESNKLEYLRTQTPLAETQILQENFVSKADLERALQNVKEDKVQMNKTGGGFWKPKVTDSDSKILAIIQDQVKPLTNPYDSGAMYFKDDTASQAEVRLDLIDLVQESSTQDRSLISDIVIEENDNQPLNTEWASTSAATSEHVPMYIVPSSSCDSPKHGMDGTKTAVDEPKQNNIITTPSRVLTPGQKKVRKNKEVPTVLKKPTSIAAFKRTYFKTKCQNACLERKKIMQDILHSKFQHQRQQQQHNLKMLILKNKLEKLNKD